MSDVYATIEMAKLIKQKQPKLFQYFFENRGKKEIEKLINTAEMTPLVHVSGMLGNYRGNTTLIAPLAWHPTNKNAVIVCDLTANIDDLLIKSAEKLRENPRVNTLQRLIAAVILQRGDKVEITDFLPIQTNSRYRHVVNALVELRLNRENFRHDRLISLRIQAASAVKNRSERHLVNPGIIQKSPISVMAIPISDQGVDDKHIPEPLHQANLLD